jgi:hypothetical protein
MFPSVPDWASLWASIEQDRRWYIMEPPAHPPHDAVNVLDSWKQLTSGAKHWKNCMDKSVKNMCGLLRAFGVEPSCTICKGDYLAFDTHTTSQKHFQVVYELVEKFGELAKEHLWNETCVVGGQVRYNYLDGELQVMRDVPLPLESVTYPQQLSVPGQWLIVGMAAVVPVQPGADKTKWPNMWGSVKTWKDKMEQVAQKVVSILQANGAHNLNCLCWLCENECLSVEHLLGPKHFNKLRQRVPENVPVNTDNFWQLWDLTCNTTGVGALAFNHVDGSLRMARRPDGNELFAPALPFAPAFPFSPAGFSLQSQQSHQSAEISVDTHERVQHQSAIVGTTCSKVSPWGKRLPAKNDAHMQPPVNGVEVFLWFWQQHAEHAVKRLEEMLVDALGPTVGHHCNVCELCKHNILPSDSFKEHVTRDKGHRLQVQAHFEHEGPSWKGWVQCWAGAAQLNHLTLDVSFGELGAKGEGWEADAAISHGRVVGDRASAHEVHELCAAVQQVAGASEGETEQAESRTARADATQLWSVFKDPESGNLWEQNNLTGVWKWREPTHMESCGPTVTRDDGIESGGQQHTSPIAALVADTGDDESSVFCC